MLITRVCLLLVLPFLSTASTSYKSWFEKSDKSNPFSTTFSRDKSWHDSSSSSESIQPMVSKLAALSTLSALADNRLTGLDSLDKSVRPVASGLNALSSALAHDKTGSVNSGESFQPIASGSAARTSLDCGGLSDGFYSKRPFCQERSFVICAHNESFVFRCPQGTFIDAKLKCVSEDTCPDLNDFNETENAAFTMKTLKRGDSMLLSSRQIICLTSGWCPLYGTQNLTERSIVFHTASDSTNTSADVVNKSFSCCGNETNAGETVLAFRKQFVEPMHRWANNAEDLCSLPSLTSEKIAKDESDKGDDLLSGNGGNSDCAICQETSITMQKMLDTVVLLSKNLFVRLCYRSDFPDHCGDFHDQVVEPMIATIKEKLSTEFLCKEISHICVTDGERSAYGTYSYGNGNRAISCELCKKILREAENMTSTANAAAEMLANRVCNRKNNTDCLTYWKTSRMPGQLLHSIIGDKMSDLTCNVWGDCLKEENQCFADDTQEWKSCADLWCIIPDTEDHVALECADGNDKISEMSCRAHSDGAKHRCQQMLCRPRNGHTPFLCSKPSVLPEPFSDNSYLHNSILKSSSSFLPDQMTGFQDIFSLFSNVGKGIPGFPFK